MPSNRPNWLSVSSTAEDGLLNDSQWYAFKVGGCREFGEKDEWKSTIVLRRFVALAEKWRDDNAAHLWTKIENLRSGTDLWVEQGDSREHRTTAPL